MTTLMWVMVAGIAFCVGGIFGVIFGVNCVARLIRKRGPIWLPGRRL